MSNNVYLASSELQSMGLMILLALHLVTSNVKFARATLMLGWQRRAQAPESICVNQYWAAVGKALSLAHAQEHKCSLRTPTGSRAAWSQSTQLRCPLQIERAAVWVQARAILFQVALTVAVAEEAAQFEHRDLHWGNLLVRRVPASQPLPFRFRQARHSATLSFCSTLTPGGSVRNSCTPYVPPATART